MTSAPGDVAALFMGLDHVGIAVPDLEASIAFHTDVLGMRLVGREVHHEQGVAEAMLSPGGERTDPTGCVQLLAPLGPDTVIGRFLARSGPGLQQVAYRVTDLAAVSATLRGRGLRLLYEDPVAGGAGSRINFLHPQDTGGVLVELVQRPDPG